MLQDVEEAVACHPSDSYSVNIVVVKGMTGSGEAAGD
jgi:hypothetical protein